MVLSNSSVMTNKQICTLTSMCTKKLAGDFSAQNINNSEGALTGDRHHVRSVPV